MPPDSKTIGYWLMSINVRDRVSEEKKSKYVRRDAKHPVPPFD
jgi:hypothetical protein